MMVMALVFPKTSEQMIQVPGSKTKISDLYSLKLVSALFICPFLDSNLKILKHHLQM